MITQQKVQTIIIVLHVRTGKEHATQITGAFSAVDIQENLCQLQDMEHESVRVHIMLPLQVLRQTSEVNVRLTDEARVPHHV